MNFARGTASDVSRSRLAAHISRYCSRADLALAAFTVFSIRQAIGIGPTPRGTGVIAPAT